LDLLFWLGPQLSIAPLFQRLAAFYADAAQMDGMPAEMAQVSDQMATLLTQSGDSSNLLGVLANSSLLHVPTLLAGHIIPGDRVVIELQNPVAVILLLISFSLLGILIGVIYMNMLARTLPIGDGPKPVSWGEFAVAVVRHWLMVLLYVVILVVALVLGSIPITLAVGLMSLISPFIGSLLLMLISGTVLVLFFYLYFVSAALILDNLPVHRAIVQSFVLVRNNFWATFGFIVLYNVIMAGFAFIMSSLADLPPFGTLVAIFSYAYIGSGLALALLVFYRTRILKQDEAFVSAT
jgi:hypothetical protein